MNQANEFLSRVDITIPLEDLLALVAEEYRLGTVRSHEILPNGYQELNILLVTTDGRYIVKIISKEKTRERIQDNVWGYLTFRKDGVPMPTLRPNAQGEYVFTTQGKRRETHLVVMDYFDGNYLYPNQATDTDIESLAQYMAKIHTHTKHIHRYYDTMGIVNLPSQYKKFKSYLSPDLLMLIDPVVKDFSSLPLRGFRHSIIHGTFEAENILKDNDGVHCILDLGCMDYNASIVDIATFLANYTIDLPADQKRIRAKLFLAKYKTLHHLPSQEIAALPTLIRVQYAAYVTRTNYYRKKLKDKSPQTNELFSMGTRGIQQWVGFLTL